MKIGLLGCGTVGGGVLDIVKKRSDMISQGPEELNIIVGVNNADFEKTVRVIYDSFVK